MPIVLSSNMPEYFRCVLGVLDESIHYGVPNANGEIELVEADDGTNPNTLTSVFVTGLPADTIVLDADKMPYSLVESDKRRGLWPQIAKYRHVSDYIILTRVDDVIYQLYVELKTGYSIKKYVPQMRCARAQMEHLQYLIRHFDSGVFPDAIEHRYVKFSKIPVAKYTTRGVPTESPPESNLQGPNDEPPRTYICYVEQGEKVAFTTLLRS